MKLRIGVWIDHRKAVLAKLWNGTVEMQTILSDLEPRVRLSGGSRSKKAYGPQDIVSDAHRDRKYHKHLSEYYRRVLEELRHAGSVYIFGPGEARTELLREIEVLGGLAPQVLGVEAADKMTDRQVAARAKTFFGLETRPATSG